MYPCLGSSPVKRHSCFFPFDSTAWPPNSPVLCPVIDIDLLCILFRSQLTQKTNVQSNRGLARSSRRSSSFPTTRHAVNRLTAGAPHRSLSTRDKTPSLHALPTTMLKKYKAFLNNEGKFEQPGARALQDFVNLYDQQKERVRLDQATKAAEERLNPVEAKARLAETRRSRDTDAETATLASRPSVAVETLTQGRFASETESPPTAPLPEPPSIPGRFPSCSICSTRIYLCSDPWRRTRSAIMSARLADPQQHTPDIIQYGIALPRCGHVYCGACLAQAIYHKLNMAFDLKTYGLRLPSYVASLDRERPEFPVRCPCCQLQVEPQSDKPISDSIARLVLGDTNMEEWNHAAFLSSLRHMRCECLYSFDIDDAVPASSQMTPDSVTCIHCPRCRRLLCKRCRTAWHENLTCQSFQAVPPPQQHHRHRTVSLSVDTIQPRKAEAAAQGEAQSQKQQCRLGYCSPSSQTTSIMHRSSSMKTSDMV
ncbi:RBR-type E3 ubiquitin transferase [Mycena kentingensis (nom. inval.)]|nr:RBR-type E3 ubiquitin transferase [Mycena kentingensis (nom. inval.)]